MLALVFLLGCPTPPMAEPTPPIVMPTVVVPVRAPAPPPAPRPAPEPDPTLSIHLGADGGSVKTTGPDGSVSIDLHPTQAEIDAKKKKKAN
jgi:hypothetical protein